MSVTFTIEGLAELRAALRKLPEELAGEAGHLVAAHGNRALVAIRGGYPVGSDLQSATTVAFEGSRVAAFAVVSNKHKLAYIYEGGTEARHYITVRGNTHLTGRMPPKHVFARAMPKQRRALMADLAELLKRKGLEVVTDDGR